MVELKNYKYKAGGYSYLDNKINPFWLYVVELLPMVSSLLNAVACA